MQVKRRQAKKNTKTPSTGVKTKRRNPAFAKKAEIHQQKKKGIPPLPQKKKVRSEDSTYSPTPFPFLEDEGGRDKWEEKFIEERLKRVESEEDIVSSKKVEKKKKAKEVAKTWNDDEFEDTPIKEKAPIVKEEGKEEEEEEEEEEEDDPHVEKVLWIGKPFFFGIPTFKKYRLTNQRLIIESGLFVKMINEVELFRVRDIQLKQNLWEQIFKVGDITVLSTDVSKPEVILQNIKEYESVKDMIRHAANIQRNHQKLEFPASDFDTES